VRFFGNRGVLFLPKLEEIALSVDRRLCQRAKMAAEQIRDLAAREEAGLEDNRGFMRWTRATIGMNWRLSAILIPRFDGRRDDVTTRRCAAWLDLRADPEEPARRYARARSWGLVGPSSW